MISLIFLIYSMNNLFQNKIDIVGYQHQRGTINPDLPIWTMGVLYISESTLNFLTVYFYNPIVLFLFKFLDSLTSYADSGIKAAVLIYGLNLFIALQFFYKRFKNKKLIFYF